MRDLEGASVKQIGNETAPLPMVESQLLKFRSKMKNKGIVDILENFLSFNPYFRKTALETVINNPLFESIRDENKESGLLKMQ